MQTQARIQTPAIIEVSAELLNNLPSTSRIPANMSYFAKTSEGIGTDDKNRRYVLTTNLSIRSFSVDICVTNIL